MTDTEKLEVFDRVVQIARGRFAAELHGAPRNNRYDMAIDGVCDAVKVRIARLEDAGVGSQAMWHDLIPAGQCRGRG